MQTVRAIGPYALSIYDVRTDERKFNYFLEFETTATAGYRMQIYHHSDADANGGRKQVGLPACRTLNRVLESSVQ